VRAGRSAVPSSTAVGRGSSDQRASVGCPHHVASRAASSHRREVAASRHFPPYELAARLAYVVWTATRRRAGRCCRVRTAVDEGTAERPVSRLLIDPKGASFLRRFLEGLSKLQALPGAVKDPTLYPQWTQNSGSLPSSMQAQASAFFETCCRTKGESCKRCSRPPLCSRTKTG